MYKDLYLKYAGLARKRFSLKQRMKFIGILVEDMAQFGYTPQFFTTKNKYQTAIDILFTKNEPYNVLISTTYNTPAKGINLKKQTNNTKAKYYQFLIVLLPNVLLVTFESFLLYLGVTKYWNSNLWSFPSILIIVLLLLTLFILLRIRNGIPRPYNSVDNSSSIITMLLLAETFDTQTHIAFLFRDESLPLNKLYDSEVSVTLDCIGVKGELEEIVNNGYYIRPNNYDELPSNDLEINESNIHKTVNRLKEIIEKEKYEKE